jgi:hypothetical protein
MPYYPCAQEERGLLECNRDGATAGIWLLKSFVNESSHHSTESYISQLKEELLRNIGIQDYREDVPIVDGYIHFYTHDRIQIIL